MICVRDISLTSLPSLASQVYLLFHLARNPLHINMASARYSARPSHHPPYAIPLPSPAHLGSARSPTGLSQTRLPPVFAIFHKRCCSARSRASTPPSRVHSRPPHPHRLFSAPIPRPRRSRWCLKFNTNLCRCLVFNCMLHKKN